MSNLLLGAGFIATVLIVHLYRRYKRISIGHIPGPPSPSFLLGHLPKFHHNEAGEIDFEWQAEYGDVVRFKAPFGEDRLLVSDPKALQYIYQTSGYNFRRPADMREQSRLIIGRGILWAEAEDHKRHRKVLLPGFGGPEVKSFWPIFSDYATRVSTSWKEMIGSAPDQQIVANIPEWASRAMLDAIGEAAFDYQFGAMDNTENELSRVWFNLLLDTYGVAPKFSIFMQNLWGYFPESIISFASEYLPGLKLKRAREAEKISTSVAKSLVTDKSKSQHEGHRDVMSLLVKANASENPRAQLSNEELYAQMRTLMLAGHETTANTLSWALLELARNPDIQNTLRGEIRAKEKELKRKGQTEFSLADLDAMPYLQAVVKEVLRFHPVAPALYREARRDDVLPLSTPITTASGTEIHELPIPKGLIVVASIAGYNRNKPVFGEDAHVFNPDRWVKGVKPVVNLGAFSNLFTFGGGLRACIGFRFALIEFQTFLAELINNFEFTMTKEAFNVRRHNSGGVMVPVLKGKVGSGAQLPLQVKLASREE